MKKKHIKKLVALCFITGALFIGGACGNKNSGTPEPPPPAGPVYYLNLSNETIEMNLFEEKSLSIDTNLDNIHWYSEDASIVSVDQDGLLKAWKVGYTTITVSSGEYSDTCIVSVGQGAIVPEVVLADKELGLLIDSGYDIQPILRCNGETYTDASFTYSSSDDEVATVSIDGRIEAKGEGCAIITIFGSWRGISGSVLTEQIIVQVNSTLGLSVDQKSFTMFAVSEFEGVPFTNTATATYTLTKNGKEYAGGEVVWETESSDILEIAQSGVITAKKAGKTRIRAVYNENGRTVTSLWIDVNVLHAIVDKEVDFTVDLWTRELPEEMQSFMENESLTSILKSTDRSTIFSADEFSGSVDFGEQEWLLVGDTAGYKVDVLAVSKIITTTEEFLYMHQYILTNVGGMYDGYLVLGNDIDFTGFKGYKTGYGTGISTTVYDPYFRDESGSLGWYTLEGSTGFNGTLDGRGYKVIGGKFANYGLFHKLTSTAVVENIAFIDCDLASSNESTTVTRENSGTIRNVFVTVASPCTKTTSAGITIKNKGTIENAVVYYQGVSVIKEGGAAAYTTTNPLSNVFTVTEETPLSGEQAFVSAEALYQAWLGAGSVNTAGFDARYWDLETYMIPVFKGYDGSIDLSKKLSLSVEYRVLNAGDSVNIVTSVPNVALTIENLDESFADYIRLENGVLFILDGVEEVMTSDQFTFTITAKFDGMERSEQVTVEKAKEIVRLGGEVEVQTKADNELLISSILPDTSAIQKVRIGDVEIIGYTITGRKITLPQTALTAVNAYGENSLQFVTADKIYEQPLFVISKLITTSDEFLRYFDDYTRTDTVGKYDGYVALGADLDFSSYTSSWYAGTDGLGWGASIYNNDESTDKTFAGVDRYEGFVGTLDGRGHTIKDMRFAKGGFFYKIGEGGVVKNIAFVNCNLSIETSSGSGYTVPVARYNRGTIDNVFITVTKFVDYGDNYGGIVHTNYGTISNVMVYYMGYVPGTGAIAYTNSGMVSNAYSVTNVMYHVNGVSYEKAEEFYVGWKVNGEVNMDGFNTDYWDFDDYLIPVFKRFDGYVGETNLKNALELTVDTTTLTVGGAITATANMEDVTFTLEGLDESFVDYVTLENGVLRALTGIDTVMTTDAFTFTLVATVGDFRDSIIITLQKAKPVVTVDGSQEVQTKADNQLTIPTEITDSSAITSVKIAGVEITGYVINDDKLVLPKASLVNVQAYGEQKIQLETATTVYEQSAFVVSKVITTHSEFLNMYQDIQTSTVGKYDGYIVLGADLDFSAYTQNWYQGCELLGWAMSVHNYDMATTKTDEALTAYDGFVGTLDGRGHYVKGMRFARGGIFYKIGAGGVVKNIAFTDCNFDVYMTKGECYISTLARHNYGEINNVFVTVAKISASKYRYSGLVGVNYASGKILNTVVYFNPSNADSVLTDSYQVEAISQWNNYGGTTTNVHAITDTARFISQFNKDLVKGYATYSAYENALVQTTCFAGIAYASQLFTAFNASASTLAG